MGEAPAPWRRRVAWRCAVVGPGVRRCRRAWRPSRRCSRARATAAADPAAHRRETTSDAGSGRGTLTPNLGGPAPAEPFMSAIGTRRSPVGLNGRVARPVGPVASRRGGRSPSRSTGGRWRCPTTAARCSRCCGTASASGPRRTAAARRASAAAARCWSTAQPRVACVTPARRVAGRQVTTVDGLERRRSLGRRVRPPAPASAGSARRGSSCAWPARGRVDRRPRPRSTRRCSPTSAGARAGRRSVEAAARDRRRAAAQARGRRSADDAARRATFEGGAPQRRGAPRSRWGGAASPTTPRPPTRSSRCADGGRLGGGRDAHRGPRRGRQGAGSADHRRRCAGRSSCRRASGPHAAHDVGRARLPGDRRVVVRPRRRAGDAAGQRRGVRRQGRPARSARSPAGSRTSTAARSASCSRGGRGALGSEAPAARRRGAGRRHAAWCAWPRTPGIAAAIAAAAPGLHVEEVDVAGPPTSAALQGRGLGRGGRAGGLAGRGAGARCARPTEPRRPRPIGSDGRRRGVGPVRASRSTRSCSGRTASAPRTWRSAGCARRASPSTTRASRSTSRSARSASCGRSTRRPSR